MNWDYPDEIVPISARIRVLGIGIVNGLIYNFGFPVINRLVVRLFQQPGDALDYTLHCVQAFLFCFALGFTTGALLWKHLDIPRSAGWVATWATLSALVAMVLPFPESVLALAMYLFCFFPVPLSGWLAMALGVALGLWLRRRATPEAKADRDRPRRTFRL